MYRTKRSVGNLFTGLVLQAMSLGVALFSTPLLLKWLGNERYGAFRAASDWGNYLWLLELGIGGSLMALLAKNVGTDDRQQMRLIVATAIRIYIQTTVVVLLAGIGLGLSITHLVPVKGVLAGELQNGYWLGLVGVLLLPFTPFRLLADASQRSYFVNTFLLFQSLLITSAALLLARAGFGIPGQYLAVLLGNISFQLLMSWYGLRCHPDVFAVIFDHKSQQNVEKQLWQLNLPTLILNLSGQLSLFTDNIIISYNLGPAAVVPFLSLNVWR